MTAQSTTSVVRVRCESCGPRVVALSSVRLLGHGERWEYTFTCGGCGSRTRRSADAALQAVLRDAGAAELILHAPPSVTGTETELEAETESVTSADDS